MAAPLTATPLTIVPASSGRWADVEAIFEGRGCSIARGCWCMYYRETGQPPPLPAGQTRAGVNRQALQLLTRRPLAPGVLAYAGETPVGWLSLGPREEFTRLRRSPIMKPVDEQPVWSVICFVVPQPYRRRGVAKALLEGGIEWARSRGATIIEAYPVDRSGEVRDDSLWWGTRSMYAALGFDIAAVRKVTRPVMRLSLT